MLPIGMKLGVRYLHIMLLSTCEFLKNRRRKGCTFLGAFMTTFLECHKILRQFQSKEHISNSCHTHGVNHLQSCCFSFKFATTNLWCRSA